ncbi:MAG: thymidine kinase [Candidatus Aenigmarchaeota archaeon]|nr:thymidine kinase [Candidatus Aenigmarchaeota archaeon]
MNDFHKGSLEVVCGPMFSGKSEELIRRMKRVQISGKKFVIFKPAIDDRYDANYIVSHDQRKLDAVRTGIDKAAIQKICEIIDAEDPEVIGFDEGNFYDPSIIGPIGEWVGKGKRVIVAGLDTDFRGETFGPMGELLAKADYVDKIKAICMRCKSREAVMTQRLVNGAPAKRSDPLIQVGGFDGYEARCRECHEIG